MEDLKSLYKIKTRTLITSEYFEFLYTLYLPLIGYKAVYLYEFLTHYYKTGKKEVYLEDLYKDSDLTLQDFYFEKKKLESIGLLSFFKKDDYSYILIINAIYSPKNFFADEILKGLLIDKIGKEKVLELMNRYSIDDDTKGYKDITSSINDNFIINFDVKNLDLGNSIKLVSTNKTQIKDQFDDSILISYIEKISNINTKSITLNELKKIHKCGVIYDLSEKVMAEITVDSFDISAKVGQKINFELLYERAKAEVIAASSYKKRNSRKNKKIVINSDTDLAKKIEYYQSVSPREFIKNKQDGIEPVSSDLNLIDYLSNTMDFDYSVINLILDYCLERLNNRLDRNYVEKIAASVKRNGSNNVLDVLNFLSSTTNNKNDNKTSNEEDDDEGEILIF